MFVVVLRRTGLGFSVLLFFTRMMVSCFLKGWGSGLLVGIYFIFLRGRLITGGSAEFSGSAGLALGFTVCTFVLRTVGVASWLDWVRAVSSCRITLSYMRSFSLVMKFSRLSDLMWSRFSL